VIARKITRCKYATGPIWIKLWAKVNDDQPNNALGSRRRNSDSDLASERIVLATAISRYGSPEYLRSDNGPEFIAKAIQDWTKEQRISSLYITPGSPWEQAHVESFHDKLRDECLNRELFGSLAEARVILEQWRVEYNQLRPHSSLGYRTPEEFAARHNLKWGVVSKDLNNPERLFTTGPARADRFWKAVSPAPVDILRTTP
jgi:transposase InsO family protein